jgi:hypothetical protein
MYCILHFGGDYYARTFASYVTSHADYYQPRGAHSIHATSAAGKSLRRLIHFLAVLSFRVVDGFRTPVLENIAPQLLASVHLTMHLSLCEQ